MPTAPPPSATPNGATMAHVHDRDPSGGQSGSGGNGVGGRDARDNVAAGLAELTEALTKLAPHFSPSIVPCNDSAEVVLERLFAKDENDCARLLQRMKKRAVARCMWAGSEAGVGSAASGREQPELRVEWAVDVAQRRRTPAKIVLLDRCAALLWDLPRLIKVLTMEQVSKHPDTTFMSELVQRFLQVNGHDLGDAHLMQDAVSVAYASFVLHKELHLTEARGKKSLQELIHASFPGLDMEVDEGSSMGEGSLSGRAKRRKTGAK
eukprot:TRINITY_DN15735_c2_g2_i1.p1 TRINITY_DN15735_c2_g2~~TRINITY_DN15735_c2_g2_i1.p1  ORF type:complete len:265 (+),score=53.60 TRINITY_DN15735_c2_g2_i1:30-824(+)